MSWKRRITSSVLATTLLLSHVSPVEAHRRKRKAPRVARHHDNVWEDLAHCESNHTSARGRYRGYFQFSLATWRSMIGRSGDPADHTWDEQLQSAMELQARSGWGQWPACSRMLGLR